MIEIKLALSQKANPNECGSCHYFDRRDGTSEFDRDGICKFKFPPTRVYAKQIWDADSAPLDTVKDIDNCDLWKSSGKTYIVSQRLKP